MQQISARVRGLAALLLPAVVIVVGAGGCVQLEPAADVEATNDADPGEESAWTNVRAAPRRPVRLRPLPQLPPRTEWPVSHDGRGQAASVRAPVPRIPRSSSLEQRLATTRLAGLHFDGEESLRNAMRWLQSASGIDILVDQEAEDAALDAGMSLDLASDRPVSVAVALDLITELAGDGVAWTTRHGIVLVTTPRKARGAPVTMVFGVNDLIYGVPSYPGREFGFVRPSGGIDFADEDLPERTGVIDENALVDLIRNTIAPGTWDEPGNSITIRNGKLIVRHD